MAPATRRLSDFAGIIRSKNAGPYRLTLDILVAARRFLNRKCLDIVSESAYRRWIQRRSTLMLRVSMLSLLMLVAAVPAAAQAPRNRRSPVAPSLVAKIARSRGRP